MPLTLRRPTTSQQWSTRLLDGLLFLAAATALIWSLPIRTPWIGLDPGWVESLVQATDAGRLYGSDVVFTFGPYHQLYTGQVSENLNFFLLGRWLYGLGWGAAMLSLRRQIGHPLSWLMLLVLAFLTSQRLDALFNSFCLIVSLTALCRIRQEALPLISYLLQLSTLVLGVLIKLSFVALAAPTILVLVGTELTHRQSYGFEKLIKVLALPLIGIGLMAPAGMGISDGWHYITGPNKDIVSGYSEAMALYRRRNDWQQLPYWLASGFTISLLVTGLKRRLQWRSPWWSVLMVGVSAIYFWSPFKAGMVRHDGGHFPMSGLFLLTAGVLTLMLFWRELNPKRAWLWLVMLLPVVAGYSISSKKLASDWGYKLQERNDGLRGFLGASEGEEGRQALRDRRQRDLQRVSGFTESFNIPEGSTADLLPWDTTDLIANKVRYTPRPIPHSLNVYSAELLELNRAFFTDPERRPQFVVLGVNSIDNRWLSTGLDGPALTAIANNYSLRNRGDRGSLVLEEEAGSQANAKETVIWQRDFTLNPNRPRTELLELPKDLPPGTSFSLKFEPTLRYKLLKSLYRPPFVTRLFVRYADGYEEKYRLVPSAAEQMPLVPIPRDEDALLEYIQAKTKPVDLSMSERDTPVAMKVILKWKAAGNAPPISRYFKSIQITLQAPQQG
ncbi:putative membrane protein [Synechococcus sp. Minos11]|uniref:hypothetical protein n=1 Tax=Synechococcus sp. Minos11 TaxID=221341 RepID=UPI001648F71E|nr:hypothetical protein [Synechococcus sp. Minos11]QNJ08313.1 putative membrane protein [Synechococcus sp. Minos11]